MHLELFAIFNKENLTLTKVLLAVLCIGGIFIHAYWKRTEEPKWLQCYLSIMTSPRRTTKRQDSLWPWTETCKINWFPGFNINILQHMTLTQWLDTWTRPDRLPQSNTTSEFVTATLMTLILYPIEKHDNWHCIITRRNVVHRCILLQFKERNKTRLPLLKYI